MVASLSGPDVILRTSIIELSMRFESDGEIGPALLGGRILLILYAEARVAEQHGAGLQLSIQILQAARVFGVVELGADLVAIFIRELAEAA